MYEKIQSLSIEDHPAVFHADPKHAAYKSPLESPVIPWALVPASYVTENSKHHYFPCKEEFLAIAQLLIGTLGRPTALCVLSGTLAGAANWEGISIEEQYRAVMESAGVFEASGMTYLSIHGQDAEKVLNMLTPRDVSTLKPGSAMFVVFTTPFGTVDNEAVVLRISQDEFLLSCCGGKPLSFLHQALNIFPNVAVTLAATVCFNIKGPQRLEAMQHLLHASDRSKIEALPVFQFCQAKFLDGTPVWIVKTKIGVEMWGGARSGIPGLEVHVGTA
jgi:glycine cleavage system aminomethyltransferase T